MFGKKAQNEIRELHQNLKAILDGDSGGSLTIFTDNKELKELAAQINRLLEKLSKTEADYRRSEMASRKMLSNISHDLKTPLTVIKGYLEIMRTRSRAALETQAGSGMQTDEETQAGSGVQTDEEAGAGSGIQTDMQMLEKAEQKAQALMELVDSFFSLAKIEAGDADIALSKLDICEVCRENVLEFYEMLAGADFQVEVELPETPVFVQGNREALQRVFSNLISNVIRYGSAGKYLGLSLRTAGQSVYVDVVDKGQGIDSAFAGNVFERLFTMEDSRSRSVQGNGLGLTIAKRLAEQMGGELTLESTPHVRTVFTVTLKRVLS